MDLLERHAQLGELARLVREARASAGKIAFVSGEAGGGKSVLVEEFVRHAGRATRVLWGHSDALQTSRALGPVNELVASISLLPGATRVSTLSREQLFAHLLERFSAPNPFSVVILEDLHWADEATLDFVRFLGRRIHRTRCLLVATYRDDELPPTHLLRGVLGELTGQHATRIHVPALSLKAIEQLVAGTRRNASEVLAVTGGNPFFVRELISSPTETVPETVRDAVLARLLQCSPLARDVAELVSLLPGKTPPWLTRAILGDIDAAADEAVMCGLLKYRERALAFRHELGRLAVESSVPRARAKGMHQQILHCLMEHDADVSQLVHHACHAEDVKALLDCAPRAAQQAALAGAHREAVAHLATSLRFVDSLQASERARLFEMHATECNLTNQVSVSLESGSQALALWQQIGDIEAQARVLLLLGRQYWKSGQNALADRYVTQAIALLEALPHGGGLAMAYSARSQLAMTNDCSEVALEFGQRALDLAALTGDDNVRVHALNNIGTSLLESNAQEGLVKLEESLAVARELNMHDHAGRAYANLISSSVRQHFGGVVTRYLSEGVEYCDVHDVRDSLSYIRAFGAQFDLNNGEWNNAAKVAAELLEHHSLAVAQRVPALVVLARVRARRGDPGVDPLLDEAASLAMPTGELQRIGPIAAARAEVAWYRGDRNRMAEEAAIGLKLVGDRRDRWIPGELAYWAHRADPALPRRNGLAEPYSLMIEGNWQAAAAAWQHLGSPYEQALALADGPQDALRESLAILEQLGSGPLATMVRQRLRELGVRGIPRGPQASTLANPARLTSRQIQVLKLLAQGHTNSELAHRLHISTKTIGHHVSSILEKLEVRSRTEAVAAAFGLGILRTDD